MTDIERIKAQASSQSIEKTITLLCNMGLLDQKEIYGETPSERREYSHELLIKLIVDIDKKSTEKAFYKGFYRAIEMLIDDRIYYSRNKYRVRIRQEWQENKYRIMRGNFQIQNYRNSESHSINVKNLIDRIYQNR